MQALQIAATGMLAQQRRTEVVSNNLANMNTTGYQRRQVEFNDLLYRNMQRPNSVSSSSGDVIPSGVHAGLGVKMASIYRVQDQGSLKSTGNSLDVAIQGAGFFQVQLPNGETAYTRDGNFQLDGEGQLVTQDGFVVQPGINVPADTQEITINASGEVLAHQPGSTTPANLGVLQTALFPNSGGLQAVGNNLFLATPSSGAAAAAIPGLNGAGTVIQGFLEASNVNPIQEITNLIKANRAYQMNSKVIQTADQMLASRN